MQKSGFDSPTQVQLNQSELNQLEESINQNRTIFGTIGTESLVKCSHIEYYKQCENFKFLPGHRLLILKISQGHENQIFEHPEFSILLQNLIQTALNNYEKPSNNYRYSNFIMDFAIYVYIMAGKACYEVVAANLPIPSASTIGKYIFKISST